MRTTNNSNLRAVLHVAAAAASATILSAAASSAGPAEESHSSVGKMAKSFFSTLGETADPMKYPGYQDWYKKFYEYIEKEKDHEPALDVLHDMVQITGNLMFASDKIGSTMTVAMTRTDAAAWFAAAPPDLTVEARVRGRDWLYSYFLAFYRDEKTPTGWNNLVFPNVVMPHVLWNLSGEQQLVEKEFENLDKAEAASIAAEGLAQISDTSSLEPLVKKILAAHPDIVEEIRAGKDRKFQFLVGQVMKETRGKGDPKIVSELMRAAIAQ